MPFLGTLLLAVHFHNSVSPFALIHPRLCRLNGDAVYSGEDLVNGSYYVAVGMEKYKNLPYVELLVPKTTAYRPFR